MKQSRQELWARFQKYYSEFPTLGLAVDLSRMRFDDAALSAIDSKVRRALDGMAELERGAIANPDEKRMVGHYWLRNPALAPKPEIAREIETTIDSIRDFAHKVHSGAIRGARGPFRNLLLIGIGGSALGPQFVSHALGGPGDKLRFWALDNTDPDGMDRVFAGIGAEAGQTLCVVVSKSGGTKETRNGMLETQAFYSRQGLEFADHAVAITQAGSELDRYAAEQRWIQRFPMWDWVGGRTSELSAVGLLPAALQGFDITAMLAGARACDEITRSRDFKSNPAAQLAAMWFLVGNGKGGKSMVVLPYKDRLELFSRYLQQLVMESLGKEKDLDGNTVHQGLTVFGNKGSTDQHAYIQQLRDGRADFFVVFIEVLRHRKDPGIEVEPGVTSGDFLTGFLLGTREALYESDRTSITLTIDDVSPFTVGVLIALFERAVGLYASMININAYHQPGVEAGKKAAAGIVTLKQRVVEALASGGRTGMTIDQIAERIGSPDELEMIFKICECLAANPFCGIVKVRGKDPFTSVYRKV